MNDEGAQILMQMLPTAPSALAYLVGGVIALLNYQRYPRPAMLVMIASGLKLMLWIGIPFASHTLLRIHQERGGAHQELGTLFAILGVLSALVQAVAFGLLIAAAFVDRRQTPEEPWSDE